MKPPVRNFSESRFQSALRYRNTFEQYGSKKIEDAVCFEFGVGREMFISLCMGAWGFHKIYAVDIRPEIRPNLMNPAAKRVQEKIGYPTGNLPIFDHKNCRQLLSERYHIKYNAPADARKTGLPDNSVDYVYANAVLEHIPWLTLHEILKECYRVLTPNGIAAFDVSYWDHTWDGKSISPYHFLQFSEKQWKKYTHCDGGHNRKPHTEYKKLFNGSGFSILSETKISPFDTNYPVLQKAIGFPSSEQLIKALHSIPLAEQFRDYTLDELSVLCGFWVLKKH
ncbi:MAG: class I SAM-dependent methyltransferase [Bacteroidales bacterium]|nr:class I SAM-dependent methyltransferase [Bacteroidales bacterium]